MEEKGEVLYELKPRFDFLYELTMPTGRKIRSSFVICLIALALNIFFLVFKSYILNLDATNLLQAYNILRIFLLIFLFVVILVFAFRVTMQILEYKGMSYKFYKDCMIFENNFLNQTKKTIEYANIKEIEIRRSIIDRIMNYGIIIIFTNADKAFGNATVIYSIKNTQEHYNNIESLVHNGNIVSNPIKGSTSSYRDEMNLKNAMNKTEKYNDSNAESDVNPLKRE